tara:strand:+ start:216 stop:560 length:345 start_codon:yes stop_codon:yes gene_type:complete
MRNEEARFMLANLLAGAVKPSKIVGAGYKQAKMQASCYLRKIIHNDENPSFKVSQVFTNTNGTAFRSEESAKRSNVYNELSLGTHPLSDQVSQYGVIEAPGEDGFMVYIVFKTT